MLKRDITKINVLIAAAGGMIGSGWLFSPFISAQIAGSNALISWVIAAIFMLFVALPLCELGTMFPISGGMTNYPSFTHGQDVGFLFAWTSWLSYVVMTPIEIQGYEPTVSVSTRKINDKVEIRVRDNGNGIPQKVMDKIFQPFFTIIAG